MTLIAVSQRTQFIDNVEETRDALDQRWCDLLDQCNVMPILIPNHYSIAQKIIDQFPFQGVLLTGGNDSPPRNKVEMNLIDFAVKNNLPLLGICHGMQMIQVYFNVSLKPISNHVMEKQEILICGKTTEVNSYHDRGTTETVSDLLVWAKAYDGIVKAICHRHLPIVGMMWHPERNHPFKMSDIHFIKNLFHTHQETLHFLREWKE